MIARLLKPEEMKDAEECQVCQKEIQCDIVVAGKVSCHYCGNEIKMCLPCAKKLFLELKSLV